MEKDVEIVWKISLLEYLKIKSRNFNFSYK